MRRIAVIAASPGMTTPADAISKLVGCFYVVKGVFVKCW
jgi:hypothetical protein